jgi:hypothetical protein
MAILARYAAASSESIRRGGRAKLDHLPHEAKSACPSLNFIDSWFQANRSPAGVVVLTNVCNRDITSGRTLSSLSSLKAFEARS